MKNIFRTIVVVSMANIIFAFLCFFQLRTERVGQVLGFVLALSLIQFVNQIIINIVSKELENNNEYEEAKIFTD